jgi:hypothetical protein
MDKCHGNEACKNEATNIVNVMCIDGAITFEVCDSCYMELAAVLTEHSGNELDKLSSEEKDDV